MDVKHLFYEYQGSLYPTYLKHGHAADHIIPIAKHFCVGKGLDIGGQAECHFPGAKIINKTLPDGFNALNLPAQKYDYIFSSHTLEHIFDFGNALMYWQAHLKIGGVLFLYLPHPDMLYWRPGNCLKHINSFEPKQIVDALGSLEFENILYSERDLFWSFAVVGINTK